MITDKLGVYLHIPFCKRKCNYCDFYSRGGAGDEEISSYAEALICEIEGEDETSGMTVDTVYFGGGTPSLLKSRDLQRILDALTKKYKIEHDAEITLEANPGAVRDGFFRDARTFGVNRISLGLQSIHENEMKTLGRIHNYREFLDAYESASRAGLDNISVDLMYGIPGQTAASFMESTEAVAALLPKHISAYSLILEEGTPLFGMKDSLSFPTEDEEIEMYDALCDRLRSLGYRHYEISNYALPGFESRHNLRYWRTSPYRGFGAAAHSYVFGARFSNTEDIGEYISCPGSAGVDRTHIRGNERKDEYIMLGLRTAEGIDADFLQGEFGYDILTEKRREIDELSRAGMISLSKNRIALTERGFYISNSIILSLV